MDEEKKEALKKKVQRVANSLESLKNSRMKGLQKEEAEKIKKFISGLWDEACTAIDNAVQGTPKSQKVEFNF